MITPTSRYQDAAKAFTASHVYDEYGRLLLNGDDVAVPTARTIARETLYRLTLPSSGPPPPLEYMAKEGESMQFMAWKYLRSHSAWWQLAEANPSIWYPLDIQPGAGVRIPN